MKSTFLICLLLTSVVVYAIPMGTNYQGELNDTGGSPLDTTVSITFTIYDGSGGGATTLWNEVKPAVIVTDGLFNVALGLTNAIPDSVFDVSPVWLGVTVGADTEMSPRKPLLSVGYAYRVNSVDGAMGGSISGKLNVGLFNSNAGAGTNVFGTGNTADTDSSFIGGGGGNDIAVGNNSVIVGGRANFMQGHYSLLGGGLQNTIGGSYSVIGGGENNQTIQVYTTVSGGRDNSATAQYASVGGGSGNSSTDWFSTIGGGVNNTASEYGAAITGGFENSAADSFAYVGGGRYNKARGLYSAVSGGGGPLLADSNSASGDYSVIGGGSRNRASGYSNTISGGRGNESSNNYATVAGGQNNTASGTHTVVSGGNNNTASSLYAVVGGGNGNTVTGGSATVSGGSGNTATSNFATVPGGSQNRAAAFYSFAAGFKARANHENAFVWGGSGDAGDSTASFNSFTFTARCTNGARFYTSHSGTGTGVSLAAGGGSWASLSDVNQKENFRRVDTKEVLDKVTALNISEWNYKSQDESIRHIGPMAQDFHAAFGLGDNNTTITTIDPDGIALAAIQELEKRNTELTARVQRLESVIMQFGQLLNEDKGTKN